MRKSKFTKSHIVAILAQAPLHDLSHLLELPEPLAPCVDVGLAHPMALGHLGHAVPIRLTQDMNDLLISESP
jgi:hypothetical protein